MRYNCDKLSDLHVFLTFGGKKNLVEIYTDINTKSPRMLVTALSPQTENTRAVQWLGHVASGTGELCSRAN